MSDMALWIAGGSIGILLLGTFWLMFREGSPRAQPWASGYEEDGEEGRESHHRGADTASDSADGDAGGGGGGGDD